MAGIKRVNSSRAPADDPTLIEPIALNPAWTPAARAWACDSRSPRIGETKAVETQERFTQRDYGQQVGPIDCLFVAELHQHRHKLTFQPCEAAMTIRIDDQALNIFPAVETVDANDAARA